MRGIVLLIATLFLSLGLKAQRNDSGLAIFQLDEDVFVYTTHQQLGPTRYPSNSMYIVTASGVVLIDTPWDSLQFQPLLDSIARRHALPVIMCIATHFHDDRTAGLAYYASKGVATYTSRHTDSLSRVHNQVRSRHIFETDTTFRVGGIKIKTYYPGAGHTADNIVIWLPRQKILYGGCLVKSVENKGIGNIADADLAAWPETIMHLQRRYKHPRFVIPGHFGWKAGGELEHTLKLLENE